MTVYPGDDLYPGTPDYYEKNKDHDKYDKNTEEELLKMTSNYNRAYHEAMVKGSMHINIVPAKQHLCPMGKVNPIGQIRHKL